MADPNDQDIERTLELVQSLQRSIRAAPDSHFTFTAPVIDKNSGRWVSETARGINKFSEHVDLLAARVEMMRQREITAQEDPRPSVEAFVTVWKTALCATAPVTGVRVKQRTPNRSIGGVYKKKGGEKEGPVDVICRGGEEWIKIYSKKSSGLIAEFREQDSMLNSDWDSEDDDEQGCSNHPSTSTRKGLQNSLIDMADMLLDLVQVAERPPGHPIPRITIRITRIPPDCNDDRRFQDSFSIIRSKGVDLVFGDLSDYHLDSLPAPPPLRTLRPSRRICLDPTALMALCSDLLHYPLPTDRAGAMKRFLRPQWALEDRPGGRHANGPGRAGSSDEESWKGQSQNSRELVKNVLEEMEAPLIQEIRDLLEPLSKAGETVEWWTTREAATYLQEALGSDELVGQGMEQRRMKRMLGLEEGDLFEGSRYEAQGPFIGFRVNILDDPVESLSNLSLEADGKTNGQGDNLLPTSFHRSLSAIARSCVDDYYAHTELSSSKPDRDLPNFLKPQRIPVPKVAQLSLPFPIVSLITLTRGCAEGMTVMMMGNVVLRDLFGQPRWRCPGWFQGSYELENERLKAGEGQVEAAVWMMPYRSLGEGKRVKFEMGDYSYPVHAKEGSRSESP